jgi:hypothetical protein
MILPKFAAFEFRRGQCRGRFEEKRGNPHTNTLLYLHE